MSEFYIEMALNLAIGVLKTVLKNPKTFSKIQGVIDEVRQYVDEADDALKASNTPPPAA